MPYDIGGMWRIGRLTCEKADCLIVFSRTACSVAGLHEMSVYPKR
jgi:hypothetical protein